MYRMTGALQAKSNIEGSGSVDSGAVEEVQRR